MESNLIYYEYFNKKMRKYNTKLNEINKLIAEYDGNKQVIYAKKARILAKINMFNNLIVMI